MDATLLAYLAIAALVLVAAIGAPLPVSSALTAAGALAAAAKFDLIALVLVASVGAVTGDVLGYAAGHLGGGWFRQGWQPNTASLGRIYGRIADARSVRQIVTWCDAMLGRRGGMGAALLLSRTVLAGFGPVVNVLSGARRYPLRRFLIFDVIGELLWAGTYIGVGFLAASGGGDPVTALTNPVVIGVCVLLALGPLVVMTWVRHRTALPASVRVETRD